MAHVRFQVSKDDDDDDDQATGYPLWTKGKERISKAQDDTSNGLSSANLRFADRQRPSSQQLPKRPSIEPDSHRRPRSAGEEPSTSSPPPRPPPQAQGFVQQL
eukprot:EG_transcript_60501